MPSGSVGVNGWLWGFRFSHHHYSLPWSQHILPVIITARPGAWKQGRARFFFHHHTGRSHHTMGGQVEYTWGVEGWGWTRSAATTLNKCQYPHTHMNGHNGKKATTHSLLLPILMSTWQFPHRRWSSPSKEGIGNIFPLRMGMSPTYIRLHKNVSLPLQWQRPISWTSPTFPRSSQRVVMLPCRIRLAIQLGRQVKVSFFWMSFPFTIHIQGIIIIELFPPEMQISRKFCWHNTIRRSECFPPSLTIISLPSNNVVTVVIILVYQVVSSHWSREYISRLVYTVGIPHIIHIRRHSLQCQ